MKIVSMEKNKGTIEIKTERRFYVIDFLNDKILSNGKEIKQLSRDLLQSIWLYHRNNLELSIFGKETILSKFILLRENDLRAYREDEAFLSMALQYPELDYEASLNRFFIREHKLTKDYLEWCRKEKKVIDYPSIFNYESIKLYNSIPKELKPYFAIISSNNLTDLSKLKNSTLLKLLKIVRYSVFHTENPNFICSGLSRLIHYLKVYDDELLDTNRTISRNYKIYQLYSNENRKTKIGLELKRLNFMNCRLFDGDARNSYIVVVPQTYEDLIDEGKQQNNCVGSFYNDSILDGRNLILFIRHTDNPTKSYITCRYDVNKQNIVEYKYKNNQNVYGYDLTVIQKVAEMIKNELK